MRKAIVFGLAAVVGAVALVADMNDAQACGACFSPPPPPGESISVVTDHRMILSISPQQTTLYDQIRYSGNPESFAWVLPISGTAEVGLSADIVFATLDSLTQTQVLQPPANCPGLPPSCQVALNGADSKGGTAGAGAADASASAPGVSVTAQQTVGPYETVQLKATDPNALTDWLTQHGYSIPAEMNPIIAAYVAEHFDFLALKLVPGKGVQSMRPVRVTTKGAAPVMPLRMVAGGTGANVGIALWMIAEGRYEPQNFPFFRIEDKDLVWDWATSSSNYRQLRADQTQTSGGKAWELESSISFSRNTIQNAAQFGGVSGGPVGQPSAAYDPIKDANGNAWCVDGAELHRTP